MRISLSWLLAIMLLGLTGCSGSPRTSTKGGKSATEWIESGNAALARGDLDQALADFSSAKDAQSDSALARERRAAALRQLKKLDQALEDCNEALKIDGKLASAYFTRGLVEKDRDEPEKAISDFSKALDSGLERVDVLAARGLLYHSRANASVRSDEAASLMQMALKDFDQAIKLDPQKAELSMQRATVRLDMGDYANAVADCNAALASDPNLAAAYIARARGECELGDTENAITDCDSAIHRDDKLAEAYVVRAKTRLKKASEMRTLAEVAQCESAVVDCQTAIELSKKSKGDSDVTKQGRSLCSLAHEFRGLIYQNLPARQKALAEYDKALSLDPNLVSTLLRRAEARADAEDYHRALSDCNTAIGINSARPEAYSSRGWIYALQHEFPKAVEDLTQAVALDRNCVKAYSRRAAVYSEMGRQQLENAAKSNDPAERASCLAKAKEFRQKCVDDATAAIGADRHLAQAYLVRGLVYSTEQLPEKALADFNAAIREDPKLSGAFYNRGILSLSRRRLDAAIKDFEEASRLEPGNPLIYLRIGQCYRDKGDPILAGANFSKADKLRSGQESPSNKPGDFSTGSKIAPDDRPDTELDPLEKAKRDLEKKLDATTERGA